MSITELRATSAMPVYEPSRRLVRSPGHKDLVRRDRDSAEQPTADTLEPGTTPRERFRAHIALVVLWAGLAIVIAAYALARESSAALVLALFVSWLMRVPWTAAFRPDKRDAARETRPITFIP